MSFDVAIEPSRPKDIDPGRPYATFVASRLAMRGRFDLDNPAEADALIEAIKAARIAAWGPAK